MYRPNLHLNHGEKKDQERGKGSGHLFVALLGRGRGEEGWSSFPLPCSIFKVQSLLPEGLEVWNDEIVAKSLSEEGAVLLGGEEAVEAGLVHLEARLAQLEVATPPVQARIQARHLLVLGYLSNNKPLVKFRKTMSNKSTAPKVVFVLFAKTGSSKLWTWLPLLTSSFFSGRKGQLPTLCGQLNARENFVSESEVELFSKEENLATYKSGK